MKLQRIANESGMIWIYFKHLLIMNEKQLWSVLVVKVIVWLKIKMVYIDDNSNTNLVVFFS